MTGNVDVLLDERALTGSYCLWSCTQEALSAVLMSRWSIDVRRLDYLSFLDIPAIGRAAVTGMDPGDVAGASLHRLASLYGVRLAHRLPRDTLELAGRLTEQGPHLARVERSLLPPRPGWSHRPGPHVVLIVGVEGDEVKYSDGGHPSQPGSLAWTRFRHALLEMPEASLPGPSLAIVTYARELSHQDVGALVRAFRGAALRALLATPADIEDGLSRVMRCVEAGRLPVADAAALVNGTRCAAQAAERLFGLARTGAFYGTHGRLLDRLRRLLELVALRGRSVDRAVLWPVADAIREHWARRPVPQGDRA